MFILIVGNFKKDEALDAIKEELGNKKRQNLPEVIKIKEPKTVYQKELNIKANVEVPKIGFGLKVPTDNLEFGDIELDLYLTMLTTILFGSSSIFRQKVRDDKLLNSIYLEWESIKGYKTFYLMASSRKPEELIKRIKDELHDIKIDKKSYDRYLFVFVFINTFVIDTSYIIIIYLINNLILRFIFGIIVIILLTIICYGIFARIILMKEGSNDV